MLQGSTAMRGLNDTPSDCEIYGHNCPTNTGTGSSSGSSETLMDKLNKGANALSQMWNAYKGSGSTNTGTPAGPAPTGGSNTMKYVLIGGGVLVGGLAIWGIASAFSSKKKKDK
jgi:hypothetical protein